MLSGPRQLDLARGTLAHDGWFRSTRFGWGMSTLVITVHIGECESRLMLSMHSSHALFSCIQVRVQSQQVRETGFRLPPRRRLQPRQRPGAGRSWTVRFSLVENSEGGQWGKYGTDGVWATLC